MMFLFDTLKSTRPFKTPPRHIVLHWTGGASADPNATARVLRNRTSKACPQGLSIHFVVSSTGEPAQFASLSMRCIHAGILNDTSIGIEVSCPGLPGSISRTRPGWTEYDDLLKNRRYKMVDYQPSQYKVLKALLTSISEETGIPLRVPIEADGSLVRRQMTEVELAAFSGVVGHYHCSKTKLDPGTRPLEWILKGMPDVG